MRVVSLFSGGGLGDLGFVMAGCEIVAQVEIDEYCQKILALRYPDAKKFRDIRTVKGIDLPECDIITGGFPCQDISINGKRVGIGGKRSGLWGEMFRLISEIRPKYKLIENVPNIKSQGLEVVLQDLASIGYDAEWCCFPASRIGFLNKRDRFWMVAYPSNNRFKHSVDAEGLGQAKERLFKGYPIKRNTLTSKKGFLKQIRSSEFVRKSNGIANRMERIKLIGNGQVPYCTKWIAEQIINYERMSNA